ncbi:Bromodomain-domain-containing protein [Testicularia cyperi]|uniref:Bromodomain-domain-containing protein n=1 Tax=Testicularia cyperi TaxID=1882483 RepID=A0A317XRG2_9BASI|nr:Bromodomain-domain-containing protein [Testicularia cyperi]
MKYLLQAIEAKRASVKLGDTELRTLLTEVCKGRDEREEFLESIDRIITELKNYTEHSTAFLTKVSKRDAPDYYEVIKHPMDLGTMQKKVKSGQYKSKKQFAHDLDLIWDNCLLYNSDPAHPLRRNVQFMRKKANHLLEFISDKSDVKDALVQWGINEAAEGTKGKPTSTAPGLANGQIQNTALAEKRRRRIGGGPFDQQEAFVRTPESMTTFSRLDSSLSQLDSKLLADWQHAGPSSRPFLAADMAVERMEDIKARSDDDPLSLTLGSVFRQLGSSHKGKEKATPEPEDTPEPPVSELDATADWFTVTASHDLMLGALPALPSSATLPSAATRGPNSRGVKRKKPFHLVPATRRKGLRGRVARNIRTIHRLQETHNKFLSLAHYVENEAPIPPYLTSMSSDEESDYPSDVEDEDDEQQRLGRFEPPRHPLARISPDSVRDHMAYNTQTILAHQGFEGGHRVAVEVMTDVMGEFLMNLGRMMRIYTDKYATKMSSEEIILHTLQESGSLNVLGLENYIKTDVERYGSKMADLLRKLRQSYREQFNMSTERGVIEDDALFADGGEALVAGTFAEDLGDDYFGFRELGLDRETGMSGLTVPTRLFYGRPRNANAAAAARGAAKENVLPYPPPPPPIPLTSAAIPAQIGLLQSFYQDQMREHRQKVKQNQQNGVAANQDKDDAPPAEQEEKDPVVLANTLPDQEQEKQRYKVPPTGKMPRRLIWSPALERKLAQDKAAAAAEKARQAAAGSTPISMATGGAGSGKSSSTKDAKQRKRQEGIAA